MDKRLKKVLNKYEVPDILNTKMQETIRCAKTELQKQNLSQRASFFEILTEQLKYISPAIWIAQVILIGVVSSLLKNNNFVDEDISIILIISACAPVIALIGVPELSKSYSCNMWEIEEACTFNLYKLLSMRMIIVGSTDIAVMTILIAISSNLYTGNLINLVLYILVPFNMASFIYLIIINRVKSKNGNYIAVAACIFFSVLLNRITILLHLYEAVFTWIWCLIFFISTALLILQIRRMQGVQKQQEELQWNSI